MSNLAMMMGLGSGAGGVAVADVFSTTLYTGNSTDDTKITTGVDTNTNGGLIWSKRRNSNDHHLLFDTENAFDGALSGASAKGLRSNDPAGEASYSSSLKSFDTDGYTIGTSYTVNNSGTTYVSWTWVEQEGFFDIQNYTGTGSTQAISHSLNADVGMIIIKQLSSGNADWSVYHRSLGGTKNMRLDSDRAVTTNNGYFADTDATSTEFTVGPLGDFNTNGNPYVAYLFAHNEDLIQCGTYTGNGSTTGPEIDLGWQPQWVMIKNTSSALIAM
jgi:hypothetical protein